MSIARHHAEWLSLIDASGPFLSLGVLTEAFPQGLDAHDGELFRVLRLAYDEWQQSLENGYSPAIHRAWVRFVLREVLAYSDEVLVEGQKIPESIKATSPEHGETVRPDWMLVNPGGSSDEGKPRLLIQIFPPNQDPEKRLNSSRWSASMGTRMMELLHATNVRLGLITNGKRWMLVNAPKGETTGFITWESNLWLEDNITLRAFRSLLEERRFFSVDEKSTIEALLAKSADDQQEVTTQLGYQVRKAVEVLVQKFDRIDKDGYFPLKEIGEKRLYKSALSVMMRLVILFSAEEQGLLLLGDALYDSFYAVSTLRAQLREIADQHGEEVLERRSDAWGRLLATFRAVHGGVQHDNFQLPAYGGHLFDPDVYPFLEGRKEGTSWLETSARALPVDNRTVLHLLEALQILQIKLPGGGSEPRRLSFRALDVEQIGHVYEGLLDHTAIRAISPVLGLDGTKDKEPEVLLEKLEELKIKGENALLENLQEETGRSLSALKKGLVATISPHDTQRFLVACDHDQALWTRVQPFAGLVRKDTLGYPVVINSGSVYVTQGSDRRSTGTHYTPKALTEPIVQYTLEPIVYVGPAEGKPKEEWQLKSASELLQLKICDIAMGSGAFLVQACRYLAERLVEAWEEAEDKHPGQIVVTPEGTLSEARPDESPIPKDPTERLIVAKRIVADRCIYGVDINPMAVEMAKLSLWLVTMQKNRPFTFLDHALRFGDSLLGVTTPEQVEYFHLNPETTMYKPFGGDFLKTTLQQIKEKRLKIESIRSDRPEDLEYKEELLNKVESEVKDTKLIADLLIGEFLSHGGKISPDSLAAKELSSLSAVINDQWEKSDEGLTEIEFQTLEKLKDRKPFHWLLEFPEVFARNGESGFDAILGNPPFMWGSGITGVFGTDYREYLVSIIANQHRGNADLCVYFFLRATKLLMKVGSFGLIATNTIAQGDTREVGLDQLIDGSSNCIIFRAISSRKWPGAASLEIAQIWLRKGFWQGEFNLDEQHVKGITTFLKQSSKVKGKPFRLLANANKSFNGSKVYGQGFVLEPEEAQQIIDSDQKNKNIIFPYLNGEDLNSRPDQSPSRWVINFFDWPLNRENAPENYKGPFAADYHDCLKIVIEQVKPERDKNNRKERREKWWQYAEKCPSLYSAIEGMERYLVHPLTSKYNSLFFCGHRIVVSHMTVVLKFETWEGYCILQSDLHWLWVLEYGNKLETRPQYTPSECFETFPFPNPFSELANIGEKYYHHRQSIMHSRQEGLTDTYNRFHNAEETSCDITQLRQLHVEMDQAVAAAYGWTDLDLGHGFHKTKQGMRYTICEQARREVLDRLLQLNHERYAEEVKAGLHDKGKLKKKGTESKSKKEKAETSGVQESMF